MSGVLAEKQTQDDVHGMHMLRHGRKTTSEALLLPSKQTPTDQSPEMRRKDDQVRVTDNESDDMSSSRNN